jgi:hypothetical protein
MIRVFVEIIYRVAPSARSAFEQIETLEVMAEPQMKKGRGYPGKHTSGLSNKIDGDDFFSLARPAP